MFSTFSLQSLLTFNPSFFTDHPQLPNLPQSATDQTPYLNDNKNLLKVPKIERPLNLPPLQEYLPLQQQPFNFLPQYYPPFQTFHRLPQHSNTKRLRHLFTEETTPPQQKQPHSVRGKSPSLIPQSKLARQRRQTLSEKTRCLQKLISWDKKMDQATLFEEAYKYVQFLQAQISALQSTPSHSTTTTTYSGGGNSVSGELKKLNRNQALHGLHKQSFVHRVTVFTPWNKSLCSENLQRKDTSSRRICLIMVLLPTLSFTKKAQHDIF
ncbi:hypothetical protein RYX36_010493 [Vicia faba]